MSGLITAEDTRARRRYTKENSIVDNKTRLNLDIPCHKEKRPVPSRHPIVFEWELDELLPIRDELLTYNQRLADGFHEDRWGDHID